MDRFIQIIMVQIGHNPDCYDGLLWWIVMVQINTI